MDGTIEAMIQIEGSGSAAPQIWTCRWPSSMTSPPTRIWPLAVHIEMQRRWPLDLFSLRNYQLTG